LVVGRILREAWAGRIVARFLALEVDIGLDSFTLGCGYQGGVQECLGGSSCIGKRLRVVAGGCQRVGARPWAAGRPSTRNSATAVPPVVCRSCRAAVKSCPGTSSSWW